MREDENGEVVMVSDADEDDEDEDLDRNFDITELITDNQVLLNRVDQLLDGSEDGFASTRRSMDG